MTPKEINIAIALHLGANYVQSTQTGEVFLTFEPQKFSHLRYWRHLESAPDDADVGMDLCVPNYSGDLNAMHEAEKAIISEDDGMNEWSARYFLAGNIYRIIPVGEQPVFATAIQRAEAFLRTVGKWKEALK